MYTWTQLQARAAALMGESSANATLQSHLNAAIKDICNKYPFSWNTKLSTGTLVVGVFNLPTDFNPSFHLVDARIVSSGQGNDDPFTEIHIKDRDSYSSDDHVYWITSDATTGYYIFNSLTQTGTVTLSYIYQPADLSSGTDKLVVPDMEAVAYLGAAKMWLGDERNKNLKDDFEQESNNRVAAMYSHDLTFGVVPSQNSIIVDNASNFSN